jgi:tetratricopeptide (TPR) repeat protein
VRDVAYAMLPRPRRAEKHVAAAQWVERLTTGREDHVETLASHYREALLYVEPDAADRPKLEAAAREALRDAGRRALRLRSHERAVGYLEQALDLWPDDGERPLLLLELGQAKYRHAQGGEEELREAHDRLLAAGDVDGVADAAVELSYVYFAQGRREESIELLRRARELMAGSSPCRTKVMLLATLGGNLSIADENDEALAVSEEAVRLAEEIGDEGSLLARALRNRGVVRCAVGDDSGFADMERGIEIARRLGLMQQVPALANLAATWHIRGDLRRAWEIEAEARTAAERFGDDFILRWLRMKQAQEGYFTGRWDDALDIADELIEGSAGAYAAALARLVRGKLRLGRGDIPGALADTEAALGAARRSRDSQLLYPALMSHGDALFTAGRTEEGAAHLDELLGELTGGESFMGAYWADVAFALCALGRTDELPPLAAKVRQRTRWLDAAELLAAGERLAAAETFALIGARPEEAIARLLAAESLAEAGDQEQAARQLEAAQRFFALVGATQYAGRAESVGAALV